LNRVFLRHHDEPLRYSELQPVDTKGTEEVLTLDGTLILSGHQPTLLPYAGFFYRMYHSDIMDICPYDPLSKHTDRYQHRVKIGIDTNWRWLTMPIDSSNGCSIMNAKLKTDFLPERWMELKQVYSKYPLWERYKAELKEIFFGYKYLWELNLRFIIWIRDLLGIKTYLSLSYSGQGCDTTERVASQFSNYGSVVYLAGKGSMEYLDMQRYERLTRSTIALVTYTPPMPFSTVSILTPLLMYEPEKVLEVLNIRRQPIKVVVNGAEYSVEYLNG
jgi:hypothetical protein